MSSKITITLTEDGDFDLIAHDKNGELLDLTGWTLLFKAKRRAADAGAPLIDKTSATPTEILIDADQVNNTGQATVFVFSAESAALVVEPHVFDLIGVEPGGKRRFLITGGRLDVFRDIGDS